MSFFSASMNSEKQKIVQYFNKVPRSFDENAIYYLDQEIALPEMQKYDRLLTIHSGIFYDDETVLVFKTNGDKEYIDFNDMENIKGFENISMDDVPLFSCQMRDNIDNLKHKLISCNYLLIGFLIKNNDKENKEIVFKCKYKDKIFIGVTMEKSIKCIDIYYWDNEKINAAMDKNQLNYVFKKELKNSEEIEFMFMSNDIHKYGVCRTIFENAEKMKQPKDFHFYFIIFRFNKTTKTITKVALFHYDCPITNFSNKV